jgi:hypothetical protein
MSPEEENRPSFRNVVFFQNEKRETFRNLLLYRRYNGLEINTGLQYDLFVSFSFSIVYLKAYL